MIYITELLKTFIALFVIINPLAIVPVYLSLVSDCDVETKRRVNKITAISVFMVLLISAVAGEIILRIFGISIAAFQVGGGVLLSIISYNMMIDKESVKSKQKSAAELNTPQAHIVENNGIGFAVVPLTIPLLTGPGTMSMAIVTASKYHSMEGYFYIIGSALMISVIIYTIFRCAERIKRILGVTGMNILTKVLSLLLMALSIELIMDGLRVLLPGLAMIR